MEMVVKFIINQSFRNRGMFVEVVGRLSAEGEFV